MNPTAMTCLLENCSKWPVYDISLSLSNDDLCSISLFVLNVSMGNKIQIISYHILRFGGSHIVCIKNWWSRLAVSDLKNPDMNIIT